MSFGGGVREDFYEVPHESQTLDRVNVSCVDQEYAGREHTEGQLSQTGVCLDCWSSAGELDVTGSYWQLSAFSVVTVLWCVELDTQTIAVREVSAPTARGPEEEMKKEYKGQKEARMFQ